MRFPNRLFIIVLVMFLSACELTAADTGEIAKSSLRRDTTPSVPPSDEQTILEGINAFAFDFYHQVNGDDGNLIFSPYSISIASALLYGGAGGETASQIANTFHFNLPPDQFHPAMNALALDLSKRPVQSRRIDRKNPMLLDIANAVWGQRDYPFEMTYLDLLAINYGAGVRLVDFVTEPDSARQQINDWVDRETNGKIKDILPPGSVDQDTRLVLANAVYFKAAWQEAFVEKLTQDVAFTLLNGSQVQVPMMQTEGDIPVRFGSGDGYQAIALPYKGDLAEMVIILPDQGAFDSLETTLDENLYEAILQELRPYNLILFMPRFEFSINFDLKVVLSGMGMPLSFDYTKADFSNITKFDRFFVKQAVHKAYILVNEEGTEAAAVSIMIPAPSSHPPQELQLNRPFIFIIRDVPTGMILFAGRVLNPLDK